MEQAKTHCLLQANFPLLIYNKIIEPRILHKLNDVYNKTETSYTRLCNTCLKEEDGIIHKLTQCPPIRYLNDIITNSAERVLGAKITKNKTSQRKPCDQTFHPLQGATRTKRQEQSSKQWPQLLTEQQPQQKGYGYRTT